MRPSSPTTLAKLAILIALGWGFSLPAYGYIDPGTGSLLIQSIIGAIAAIGVTLKLYWHKIKVFFFAKKDPDPAPPADDKPEA